MQLPSVLSRGGNEQCWLFGEHGFVFVVLFGIWFPDVFGLCLGVFRVWCLRGVLLCLVFSPDVVLWSAFGRGDGIS